MDLISATSRAGTGKRCDGGDTSVSPPRNRIVGRGAVAAICAAAKIDGPASNSTPDSAPSVSGIGRLAMPISRAAVDVAQAAAALARRAASALTSAAARACHAPSRWQYSSSVSVVGWAGAGGAPVAVKAGKLGAESWRTCGDPPSPPSSVRSSPSWV